MTISRHHLSRNAVRDEHIPSGEIPYGDIKSNAIQIVIPIMVTSEPKSVAADSVGLVDFAWTEFRPPTNTFKHLKSAEAAIAYSWAATADGTIQLYDTVTGATRGESTTKTGGEITGWETFGVTGLVEGNTLKFRVNVTVAGAAGETVVLEKAYLILTLGVS